ncbi:MAG: FIST signal transduction protein [Alphaproteobacteria bacterium]
MTPFTVVHTASQDWAHAARVLADGLTGEDGESLGFLYLSDPLTADTSSILTYLRQKTGIEHWVGAGASGVLAIAGTTGDYYERPGAVAMAARLPEDSFRVLANLRDTSAVDDWIAAEQPFFGIVHAAPTDPALPQSLDDLSAHFAFLVGGLTSSHLDHVQIADALVGGGMSGVLFSPSLSVVTGLSQGCAPISETHVVTDCQDGVIIGLDGRPALEVFSHDIGDDMANDLARVAGVIHAALPVEGSDTGDYTVRSLLGVDPKRGMLAIDENVQIGSRLMFVRRDQETAQEDLRHMVRRLEAKLTSPPRGGLYFSCVARGPSLFGTEGRELEIIRDCLGDVPIVGFYGNGEISNARLYGYTGVLALFI